MIKGRNICRSCGNLESLNNDHLCGRCLLLPTKYEKNEWDPEGPGTTIWNRNAKRGRIGYIQTGRQVA